MQRSIDYLSGVIGPLPFDYDQDGDVDSSALLIFGFCFQGPNITYPDGHVCRVDDANDDGAVDLVDVAVLQKVYTGSQ